LISAILKEAVRKISTKPYLMKTKSDVFNFTEILEFMGEVKIYEKIAIS
jgi:hypothetical protein